MLNSPEFLSVITPAILTLLTAVIGVAIAWAKAKSAEFELRSREWERIANEARDQAQQARQTAADALKTSSQNNRLIAENTRMTREVMLNTDGVNEKLKSIAAASVFTLGKIKAQANAGDEIDTSEIEELERKFQSTVKDDKKNGY